MQRYFSHEEAEALIPRLERLYDRVAALKDKAQKKARELQDVAKNENAGPVNLALLRSQTEFLITQIEEQLREIAQLGCIPKGLDPCLVDFPCRVDGQEVYLCWKCGEKSIDYYHGLQEGYAGRKPLTGRALLKKIFGE